MSVKQIHLLPLERQYSNLLGVPDFNIIFSQDDTLSQCGAMGDTVLNGQATPRMSEALRLLSSQMVRIHQ